MTSSPTPPPGTWPPPPLASWQPPTYPAVTPVGYAAGPPAPWQKSPFPTRPTRYAQFWRSERWSWWKSVMVLAVGAVSFFVLSMVVTGIAFAAGWLKSIQTNVTTPGLFIVNNVMLALLVPVCLLLAWGLVGQRPGFLSSMTGKLRWGWLARCLLVLAPFWLIMGGLEAWSSWNDPEMALHTNPSTWTLIVAIVLTTPFQCAGEEYAFRGLVNRSVGAWFASEPVAFVAGGVVSAALFTLSHAAGDMWLNLTYFIFGGVAAWMTRRTGGLEAAIAMHVVNNMTAEWMLPFTDISGMFNREAGTAGPAVLLQLLPLLLGALAIEWAARRHQIAGVVDPPAGAGMSPGAGSGLPTNAGAPTSWQAALPPQQFPQPGYLPPTPQQQWPAPGQGQPAWLPPDPGPQWGQTPPVTPPVEQPSSWTPPSPSSPGTDASEPWRPGS